MSDGRLLVVEDDLLVAAFLRAALARSGSDYELDLVHTLGDAVQRVADPSYIAVLLDLGLPDADGLAALEKLRPLTEIPILVTTGSTDQREPALAAGANAFLGKVEYDVAEFVDTLAKLTQ